MGKVKKEVKVDRRLVNDRRDSSERRKQNVPVAVERRSTAERRKVPRRRQIDPTTCERDYSTEEIEFMQALDAYKRANGRMFPTCSEILEVIRGLGYVRVAPCPTLGIFDDSATIEAALTAPSSPLPDSPPISPSIDTLA